VTLVEALARLKEFELPALRTADLAAALGLRAAHASTILARLAHHGHVVRLKRGLWALAGKANPFALVAHLTAPLPSYLSLQTALYHRGMISQVPQVIYAVSLARTRRYATPLGVISVHHVPPQMLFGFDEIGDPAVRMAQAEKALVDFLYLSPGRSRLFSALPELELPRGFSVRRARAMLAKIPDPRRRALVTRRLDAVLEEARAT
jgi:predicted transcriptional regulator of viral defense system